MEDVCMMVDVDGVECKGLFDAIGADAARM
jgi:hypothetical protein